MVIRIIPAIGLVFLLSSCSVFKSLNLSGNKQGSTVSAVSTSNKFINEISVTPQAYNDKTEVKPGPQVSIDSKSMNSDETGAGEESKKTNDLLANRGTGVETASAVQLKYAVLLNTELESLPNKILLENVDEWYGVRYRKGGNGKNGVDCSGFSMSVYAAVYGIALPRVAREQYRISRKISTTELQEGDLVFFNTAGRDVSHVGVYLGNNRFIHATVSKGVMVNNLFESYYLKRFIGAGRIDDKQVMASN